MGSKDVRKSQHEEFLTLRSLTETTLLTILALPFTTFRLLFRAHRFIHSTLKPRGPLEKAFNTRKEIEAIENRIQPIGNGAIAPVLGIGMMGGMPTWTLQQLSLL